MPFSQLSGTSEQNDNDSIFPNNYRFGSGAVLFPADEFSQSRIREKFVNDIVQSKLEGTYWDFLLPSPFPAGSLSVESIPTSNVSAHIGAEPWLSTVAEVLAKIHMSDNSSLPLSSESQLELLDFSQGPIEVQNFQPWMYQPDLSGSLNHAGEFDDGHQDLTEQAHSTFSPCRRPGELVLVLNPIKRWFPI